MGLPQFDDSVQNQFAGISPSTREPNKFLRIGQICKYCISTQNKNEVSNIFADYL